jgi:hypothetical protein
MGEMLLETFLGSYSRPEICGPPDIDPVRRGLGEEGVEPTATDVCGLGIELFQRQKLGSAIGGWWPVLTVSHYCLLIT